MHDLLFQHQDKLDPEDLVDYAYQLGLDVDRFTRDLTERRHAARVDRDVESADVSAVGGTPTFFINGRRHPGAYDIGTLSAVVKAAGARAAMDL
jgi:protein-disulfide isomerase